MSVKVRLPGSLRDATGGETRIESTGGTLAAVVADLERRFPALRGRILDEQGSLQSYVNVYIGDQDARQVGGGEALVADDADVMVIPAMSGGEVAGSQPDGGTAAGEPFVQRPRVFVDARGSVCPTPIVTLATAVRAAPVGGLIELVATDPGCGPDVRAWSRQTGNEIVEAVQRDGEFHFLIRRLR